MADTGTRHTTGVYRQQRNTWNVCNNLLTCTTAAIKLDHCIVGAKGHMNNNTYHDYLHCCRSFHHTLPSCRALTTQAVLGPGVHLLCCCCPCCTAFHCSWILAHYRCLHYLHGLCALASPCASSLLSQQTLSSNCGCYFSQLYFSTFVLHFSKLQAASLQRGFGTVHVQRYQGAGTFWAP